MNYFQVLISGIVEGITEFLPISSTAHLLLSDKILGIVQTDFTKSFNIAIQLGAILAVVWLYAKNLILDKETIKRVLVAFLPTGILGFLLYKIFKTFLMENSKIVVWSLILGGIVIILFEIFHKEKDGDIEDFKNTPYWKYALIGIIQSIAIIPGISRSAATIIGGMFLGFKRKTIVEFSFLLAIPTMLSATSYDLLKNGVNFSKDQFGMLAFGFLVSFAVAILAIKFLLRFIKTNNFVTFGIYRILIGLIFLLFLI